MSVVREVALLLWKDVVVELRAKELLFGTVFFGAILVLIFAFAFYGGERPPVDVMSGVLWVAIALSGTLAIGRAFEREREGNTLRALLLAPISRSSLYLSKLIAIALLMAIVELVVAVLLSFMLHASLIEHVLSLAALLLLGTVGFGAVASLFGAALGRARSRDVLLPLLVYPLSVPVLIAGTRATTALLLGEDASFWLKFLLVYDAIFISIGVWVFEPVAVSE